MISSTRSMSANRWLTWGAWNENVLSDVDNHKGTKTQRKEEALEPQINTDGHRLKKQSLREKEEKSNHRFRRFSQLVSVSHVSHGLGHVSHKSLISLASIFQMSTRGHEDRGKR